MPTLGNRLGQAGVATGNMNANYNRHRRDWAVMMRVETTAPLAAAVGPLPSSRGGGAPSGRGTGAAAAAVVAAVAAAAAVLDATTAARDGGDGAARHGGAPIMSSDQRVLERFRKREQNRRR